MSLKYSPIIIYEQIFNDINFYEQQNTISKVKDLLYQCVCVRIHI